MAEYARLSMVDVEDLNVVDFCLLLRDSVIYRCSQTDKGLEYLENCWRITQTKISQKVDFPPLMGYIGYRFYKRGNFPCIETFLR